MIDDFIADTNNIIATTKIVEENNYYPFGLKHKGYNGNINGVDHKYGFGGKEEQDDNVGGNQLNWIDFGARNYDASLGRWMNIDPLADKYTNLSPYSYVANNPLNLIDPDGRFIVSAEFQRRFPKITEYLRNNIKSDVLNSKILLDALRNNSTEEYEKGAGNLSIDVLKDVLTFDQGPKIKAVDKINLFDPDGFYDYYNTKEIQLKTERLVSIEKALLEGSNNEKQTALLSFFRLLLHELVHYGDMLDGLEKENEPGNAFDYDVWLSDEYGVDDFWDPKSLNLIIEEKRKKNYFTKIY